MPAFEFILGTSFLFLTATAVAGLRWAIRDGQFRHLEKTALSIFDDEEPVGEMSDQYPGRRAQRENRIS